MAHQDRSSVPLLTSLLSIGRDCCTFLVCKLAAIADAPACAVSLELGTASDTGKSCSALAFRLLSQRHRQALESRKLSPSFIPSFSDPTEFTTFSLAFTNRKWATVSLFHYPCVYNAVQIRTHARSSTHAPAYLPTPAADLDRPEWWGRHSDSSLECAWQ